MRIRNTLLAVALGAGMGTAAQAVNLDPGGTGQALIYPYYTVNAQQQTLLSVTNTTGQPKVARLRFREGYNGREVLEFNLWLSPYDVWTATVFAMADAGLPGDGAALMSSDRSCTTPALMAANGAINGQPYVPLSAGQFHGDNADGGPVELSRTREGWIEIIAMADLLAGTALASAITHTASGTPANCAAVRDVASNHTSLVTPGSGLTGTASVINVGQGTLLSTKAEALAGFTSTTLFSAPDNRSPNLSSVNEGTVGQPVIAHVSDSQGRIQSLRFGGPGINGSPPTMPVDAVTAVFMADRVRNEYSVNPGLGASSDWVLTFPTKNFYTDPRWTGTGVNPLPPFQAAFGPSGRAPVAFTVTALDRQGQRAAPSSCAPIQPCDSPAAGFVVNVLAFSEIADQGSSVLHSRLPVYSMEPAFPVLRLPAAEGTAELGFSTSHLYSMEGKRLAGMPVIGFWASNLVNNQVLDGVLSNYGAAMRHRTHVECAAPDNISYCD